MENSETDEQIEDDKDEDEEGIECNEDEEEEDGVDRVDENVDEPSTAEMNTSENAVSSAKDDTSADNDKKNETASKEDESDAMDDISLSKVDEIEDESMSEKELVTIEDTSNTSKDEIKQNTISKKQEQLIIKKEIFEIADDVSAPTRHMRSKTPTSANSTPSDKKKMLATSAKRTSAAISKSLTSVNTKAALDQAKIPASEQPMMTPSRRMVGIFYNYRFLLF